MNSKPKDSKTHHSEHTSANHSKKEMPHIKKIEEENSITEFYKCINIILNILSFIHNSIIYNSFENYIKIKYK